MDIKDYTYLLQGFLLIYIKIFALVVETYYIRFFNAILKTLD